MMTTAQRIAARINAALDATRKLSADLSEHRRAGPPPPDIDPDDPDDPDLDPDDPDDPDAEDTGECQCPCSSFRDGRCSDCSASPCDDVNCDHRDRDPDPDDDED